MMSEEWSDIAINEKVAVNICWLFPLEKNCICEKEMKQFYSSLKPHQGAKRKYCSKWKSCLTN